MTRSLSEEHNLRLLGLYKISQCFKELKIHHIISDGALLGFIRDNKLIEWDWDAEISMRYTDYKDNLLEIIKKLDSLQLGEVLIRNNSVENPKTEVVREGFKYTIQAFHYSKNKKMIYRKMYKYPAKFLDETKIYRIQNYYFPIPKDSQELIELEYGENWKIPLETTVKDEYLSSNVYTLKNNIILNQLFRIFVRTKNYIKLMKKYVITLVSLNPLLEYNLGIGLDRLFIYQILRLFKGINECILISIGSSELKENIIINELSDKKVKSIIYEASIENFKSLKAMKILRCLSHVQIKNNLILAENNKRSYEDFLRKNISDYMPKQIESSFSKTLQAFHQIEELENDNIHKIIKIDSKGYEEEVIIRNSNFISGLVKTSLCIKIYPQYYQNQDKLKQAYLDLMRNGYEIKFAELTLFCNPKLIAYYRNLGQIIDVKHGRYILKSPELLILESIVNCDYRLIKSKPYYNKNNVRSITLSKDK